MSVDVKPSDLLPLRRMAARLGVPCKWLKERAEAGQVPGLRAGNRWLFRPDVVLPVVAAMAAPVCADADEKQRQSIERMLNGGAP
jgi:hypothetical protein